jgi:hypothetical protein
VQSLAGIKLTDDLAVPAKFTFPLAATIPAKGYLVLYGGSAPAGSTNLHLGFELKTGGETLHLFLPNETTPRQSVTFGSQLRNMSYNRSGNVWTLGTPTFGAFNAGICETGSTTGLRINEWLCSNDYIVAADFVEIYNPSALPVDLGGHILSTDAANALAALAAFDKGTHRLAPGTFIPANGFLLLYADGNPGTANDHLNLTLSRALENIALLSPAGQTIDQVVFGPGREDESQGRTVDGGAAITYQALPTPGLSNGLNLTSFAALRNSLRVTEVMYHPSSGADFIELKNIGNTPLDITGVTFTNGISFTFGSRTLAAGEIIVLNNNPTMFAAMYPGVTAAGTFTSNLSNDGERVRYELGDIPLGILDFDYSDAWYPITDGRGASLQIVNANAAPGTWDEATSWQAGVPSPGTDPVFGVLAGADQDISLPSSAQLTGSAFPGSNSGTLTVAWSKVGGPGNVSFSAPANGTSQASFSAPGVYTLRLTASIGANTASDELVVFVQDTYAAWALRNMLSTGPNGDADGDGIPNLVEYALGMNPNAISQMPALVKENGKLTMTFTIPENLDGNVNVVAEVSSDLQIWSQDSADVTLEAIGNGPAGTTLKATDLHTPATNDAEHFLRLRVELAQP